MNEMSDDKIRATIATINIKGVKYIEQDGLLQTLKEIAEVADEPIKGAILQIAVGIATMRDE